MAEATSVVVAPPEHRSQRAGVPAGVVTRGMAYVTDIIAATALYSLGVSGTAFLVDIVTGGELSLELETTALLTVGWLVWWVAYFALPTAYAGRTLGKGLFGLRVLRTKGQPVGFGRSVLRSMAVPVLLSFTLGIDAVIAAVSTRRRALHDMVCGTVVVYDWPVPSGERRLRFLGATGRTAERDELE